MTTTQPDQAVDNSAVEAFVGRVLADTSAAMITILCGAGDRLGLYEIRP